MPHSAAPWGIVLAAGDGTRLRALTTVQHELAVPKQFCSLRGGPTLLGDTIARAHALGIPSDRVVTIVAAQHRQFWQPEIEAGGDATLDSRNLVVQPHNRGTAAGLLLPLLVVLERDPDARVVVLPSDHHVERPSVLRRSVQRALEVADTEREAVSLLGMAAESPEADYGWVVPEPGSVPVRRVARFVEKPSRAEAADLRARGGLWNSLVIVARGRALLELLAQRLPWLTSLFLQAFGIPAGSARSAVFRQIYDDLETFDLSKHVLQGAEHTLRAVEVAPCGWTDLGTPERVAACLSRTRFAPSATAALPRRRLRPLVVLDRAQASTARRAGRSAGP